MRSSDQLVDMNGTSGGAGSARLDPIPIDCETCQQYIDEFFEAVVSYLPSTNYELLHRALRWANDLHKGQERESGHHYLTHVVAVARLTAVWCKMPAEVIAAAILHDCIEDSEIKTHEVEKLFNEEITFLVDSCTKIKRIEDAITLSIDVSGVTLEDKRSKDGLAIAKLFEYSLKDARVLVIKLMDRYHNMETLRHVAREKRRRKAEETMRIYVPLADRLGMAKFARALETLCLEFIDPPAYREADGIIAGLRSGSIPMSSSERLPQHVKLALDSVSETMLGRNLAATVEWHVPSSPEVFRAVRDKPQREKEMAASDLCYIQVVCSSKNDRGAAVDAIHGRYERVPESHQDDGPDRYPNEYRTIRTTVFFEGRPTPIVFRDRLDQDRAEGGIPVGWQSGAKLERGPWRSPFRNELRGLLAGEPELHTFDDKLQNILSMDDRIPVFVDGERLDVPVGVTPLDAAFLSDPERVVECDLVWVDHNEEVDVRQDEGPLQPLEAYQTVFFLGVEGYGPDPNWCRESSGMLALEGNRALVQQRLARLDPNESVPLGHQELVENPDNASLSEPIDRRETAGLTRSESVGVSEVGMNEVQFEIVETEAIPAEKVIYDPHATTDSEVSNDEEFIRRHLIVVGRPEAKIRVAECCDVQVGADFAACDRGRDDIRVHLSDCANVKAFYYPERIVKHMWLDLPTADGLTATGGAKTTFASPNKDLVLQSLVIKERDDAELHRAGCCKFGVGDDIVPYYRGWEHGIRVHSADCPNVSDLPYPERVLEYEWIDDRPIADVPNGSGGAKATFRRSNNAELVRLSRVLITRPPDTALCCLPRYGDEAVVYHGADGPKVHAAACHIVAVFPDRERIVKYDWPSNGAPTGKGGVIATLEILTGASVLAAREVSRILERFGANVIESVTDDVRKTRDSIIRLTVLLKDSELLTSIVAALRRFFGDNSVKTFSIPLLSAA